MITREISEQIGDVVESISAIKGEKYMAVLTHTLNLQSLSNAVQRMVEDPLVVEMHKLTFVHLMADLSRFAGIDLEDEAVRAEFDRNLEVVREALGKIFPK